MMKNGTVFAIWKEKSGNGRPVEAAGESHGQVNRMDILRKKRPDANIIRPLLL